MVTSQVNISNIESYDQFSKTNFIIIAGIKKHRVNGKADKLSVAKMKKIIQRKFKRQMGLNIDMPRDSGHGTTNDGWVKMSLFTVLLI